MPPVGGGIRAERMRRGMSVRGLAREIGVSASLISQIETGRSRPSVSTLYAITKALGISVEDLFDAQDHDFETPSGPVTSGMRSIVKALGTSGATTVLDASADGHQHGPLTHPTEREVLELDSGVTWQRLGHVPGVEADFLLVTYAPGGSSSSSSQLMRHAGVEYGYLLEGTLILTLGFDEHILGPGDAVSFPSTTPHRYRNDSDRLAVGVWFVHDPHAAEH